MIDSDRLIANIDANRATEDRLKAEQNAKAAARFADACKALAGFQYDILQAGRVVHHLNTPIIYTGLKDGKGNRLAFICRTGSTDGTYKIGLGLADVTYFPDGTVDTRHFHTDIGSIRRALLEKRYDRVSDADIVTYDGMANAVVEMAGRYPEMEKWLVEYIDKTYPAVPDGGVGYDDR